MSKIAIVDSTMINVLNYSKSLVSVPTQINPDGYAFYPSIDDQPSLIPLSFAEIRVINGQSQIFKEGYLRFDSDVEEDVYNALNIRDWENILSDDEIKETIVNPTKERLERLIKITSMAWPIFTFSVFCIIFERCDSFNFRYFLGKIQIIRTCNT